MRNFERDGHLGVLAKEERRELLDAEEERKSGIFPQEKWQGCMA